MNLTSFLPSTSESWNKLVVLRLSNLCSALLTCVSVSFLKVHTDQLFCKKRKKNIIMKNIVFSIYFNNSWKSASLHIFCYCADPIRPNTHLKFTILCSIMEGGPSPVVSDDLPTMQQKPAEDLCVTTTGCKMHRRGSVTISVCQADLGETHLQETRWRLMLSSHQKDFSCFWSNFCDSSSKRWLWHIFQVNDVGKFWLKVQLWCDFWWYHKLF